MVKLRTAKIKGSQFEYSVRDSLISLYPDILLTKQEGFVQQYDILSRDGNLAIECKKHRAFSWNELIKYWEKLRDKVKSYKYKAVLVFQANRQPCLVMFSNMGLLRVMTFEDHFGVPFMRHNGGIK